MSTPKITGNGWTAYFRGTYWDLRYYEDGKRRLHRVPQMVRTEKEARQYIPSFITARLGVDRATGESPLTVDKKLNPRITIQQFGELWTSGKLHQMFPVRVRLKKSAKTDASRLETHVYPVIGQIQVRAFQGEKGVAWAESVISRLKPDEQGGETMVSQSTMRQVGQVVNRLLTLAAYPDINLIPHNPLPKGYVPPKEPGSKAKSYIYPSEDAALMANTDVPLVLRMFYGLSIREGARLGNFRVLRFKQLNLDTGVINLDDTKTFEPLEWVMDPGTTEALMRYRDRFVKPASTSDFVFLNDDGKMIVEGKVLDPTKLADKLRECLVSSGVTREELFEHTNNRIQLRAHDLRASFVTTKLAIGKTDDWVMRRTGHESLQTLALYKRKVPTHQEANHGDYLPLCEAIPELRDSIEPLSGG